MANGGGFGGGFGEALESMQTAGKQFGKQVKQTATNFGSAAKSQVGLPQITPQGANVTGTNGAKSSAGLGETIFDAGIDEKNQGQSQQQQGNQNQTTTQPNEQSLSQQQDIEKQKKEDEAKIIVARQAIQDLQEEMQKLRAQRTNRDEQRKQEGDQMLNQQEEQPMQPVAVPGSNNQPLENIAEQRAKTKTEAGRGATG